MSGLKKHKDLTSIHRVQCFEYADAATRTAATGFVPADIGKVARDLDTNCFWVLVDDDPATWEELTNKTIPADLDVKVAVSAADTTAGYLDDELDVDVGTNTTNALEKVIQNPAADENLRIRLDPTKIDHDNLLNSGGNKHIDWTASSAGTIDPSNYSDEDVKVSANDTTPGKLIDKIQPGTNVTVTENNDGGNETITIAATGDLTSDCPTVQARRSTTFAIPVSYADITYDTTDVETTPGSVEHDNTNTDRILIKEDGLYKITYSGAVDFATGTTIDFRVRKNDAIELPGSHILLEDDDDIFGHAKVFYAELVNGDFVSMQMQDDSGSTLQAGHIFTVEKCAGAKGDKGDTGAGSSISLETDDVAVAGGPHDTVNFSDDFVVTNNGGGKATVSLGSPANVFGTEFTEAESLGQSSTGSTFYQQKVSLVTGVVPAGRYRVGYSYRWRHSSTGGDFSARIEENNTTTRMIHQQEPKDSGSDQAFRVGGFFNTTLTNASHQFDLDFREQSGGTAFISEARLEFWRVS